MKISLTSDDFISAIRWTTASRDDLATVRLTVNDDGTIGFSCVSSTGERTITIPATVTDPIDTPLELVSSALRKVPAQVTSSTVELSFTDRDKTQVLADVGLKLKLPIMSGRGRLIHGVDGMDHVGILSPADLFYVTSKVGIVTNDTLADLRYSYIFFETDYDEEDDDEDNNVATANDSEHDDRLRVVASDGYGAITMRKIPFELLSGDDGGDDGDSAGAEEDGDYIDFLISPKDIKNMSDASKATAVDLYIDDDAVLFSFDDGRTARVSKYNMDYLNYEQLVQYHREGEEHFDVAYADLNDAVNRLGAWVTSDEDNKVYFDVLADSNEIKIHNSTNTWDTTIPFVGEIANDYHVVYPYMTISRVLGAIDSDTIRYGFLPDPDPASSLDYGTVWSQIKSDGTVDDAVYLFSMPVTPDMLG